MKCETPIPSSEVAATLDIEVQVLRSCAEIEQIRHLWEAWQDNLNADLDFYLLINRMRDNVIRPHVILVLSGGKPTAMAVGRIERGVVNLKLGYKSIAHFNVVTLGLIFGGLIGQHTPQVARAVLSSLRQSLRDGEAEMISFNFLPADSEIIRHVESEVPFFCRNHFAGKQVHWGMALACSVEEMYARLSRDHRQQIRRKNKLVEKDFSGRLEIRSFRKTQEMGNVFLDVEQIAKSTYQRGLGVGFMNDNETKTRMAFEAEKGWLLVNVLYLEGSPCAYWWGTIYQDTFYSCSLGFDVKYSKYSPGTYLVCKTFEALCNQGVKSVDFGLGDARYKQQFASEHQYETTVYVTSLSPRLIAMNAMTSLNNGIKAGVHAVDQRFKFVDKVRKRWRSKIAVPSANEAK